MFRVYNKISYPLYWSVKSKIYSRTILSYRFYSLQLQYNVESISLIYKIYSLYFWRLYQFPVEYTVWGRWKLVQFSKSYRMYLVNPKTILGRIIFTMFIQKRHIKPRDHEVQCPNFSGRPSVVKIRPKEYHFCTWKKTFWTLFFFEKKTTLTQSFFLFSNSPHLVIIWSRDRASWSNPWISGVDYPKYVPLCVATSF